MKLKLKSFAGILAIGLVAFASCKKKSDGSPKSKLTGKWKVTKTGYDANNNGTLDANESTTMPDSVSEYVTLNGDGTGTATDTYSGTTQTNNFKWELINNNADIKITNGTAVNTVHIESLSSSDLQTKLTETSSGVTYTYWTFYHKQ